MKKKYGNKKWIIMLALSIVLTVAMVVSNIVTTSYEQVINIALGTVTTEVKSDPNDTSDTEYFKSAYDSTDEVKEAGQKVAEQLTEEGAVLLKNENNTLPLSSNSKVSLFGHSSVNVIVCGTGSADIDASGAPTFKEALESRGIKVNPSLWQFYEDNIDNYATNPKKGDNSIRNGADGVTKGAYTVNEIPWSDYTDASKSQLNEYNDAAIVMISRLGGEMYDLPASDEQQGNVEETVGGSGNSLELTIQERELLKEINASGQFDKIIVLINSTNAMECDFIDDPELGLDSAMWIGYTGVAGLNGVSDLLVGNSNPSGRLVDTFAMDNTTSPSFINIYGGTWSNVNDYSDIMYDLSLDSNMYYNVYQEGIYVGYRYYETRYEDYVLNQGNPGDYNYNNDVKYPFGYGISYTNFERSDYQVKENDDNFEVSVKVTNTGDVAGKDVIQTYFQSPYSDYDRENSIEKAAVELCGFGKTSLLEPGASEVVNIVIDKEELRTYDANKAKTYILDAGDYYITAADNAHNAINNILSAKGADESRMTAAGNKEFVYKWNNPLLDGNIFATSNDGEENFEITNEFDNSDLNKLDSSEQTITYLSRSDWTGTFPKEPVSVKLTAGMSAEMTGIKKYEITETDNAMPIMGAKGSMTLAQVIGKSYDDPSWNDLLNQVTYEEMAQLIGVGYHGTKALSSVAKPSTADENGPQGFTKKLTDVLGNSDTMTAYSDENIMAATFNVKLIEELGEQIGEDGLALGIYGLYGPAMDTHRSPYSGRNFEYYSEDGFLAGTIAAAEVKGIQSKGVYVYIKHFALNDSETHCRTYSIFSNEQAIREIYLEPFKHAVVEGGASNVMNSFARVGVVWAGAHEGLMTNVLRKEWGMAGFALTDYSNVGDTYDIKLGLLAGTDSWDSSAEGKGSRADELLKWEDKHDAALTLAMREATHRILFTVANSAAMNGVSATSKIILVIPWWRGLIYGLFLTGVAGIVGSLIMLRRIQKKIKTGRL